MVPYLHVDAVDLLILHDVSRYIDLQQVLGQVGPLLQLWHTRQQPFQNGVDDRLLSLHQAHTELIPAIKYTNIRKCPEASAG